HGLAMMRFLPDGATHAAAAKVMEQYGGFKFKNQGFQFYKHPPAEAYGLNRLLFEIRHSGDLRDRVIADLDAVAKEYDLNATQRRAPARRGRCPGGAGGDWGRTRSAGWSGPARIGGGR